MIEFEKVTKIYNTGKGADQASHAALDGISLRFVKGQLVAVAGPSGSGKSTLLRMINRMVEPDEGTVKIEGVDVRSIDPVMLRRNTGYVIQGVGLFPHLSVADNIAVVPSLLGWSRKRIADRVDELLHLVRLPESWKTRRPSELSGGEAQRVGVARALAADPPLILMDEPFGSLDALTRIELQDEFDRIRRELGKTVILVTHDLMEAFKMADRIMILRDGRLVRDGSPGELAADPGDALIEEFISGIRAVTGFVHAARSSGMTTGKASPS